ncbi:MAG: response regulator transcription factor [Lachnospiraceae bacterium]|nr:response regulator transcription factor [Lachnospiraceae bacterium]
MKILIIEDDTGLNRGICFALEQDGYEVITARNMKDGYNLFEEENPDAIILDLNLPDGDGLNLCRKIRSYSAQKQQTAHITGRPSSNPDVPLIMLTARDMETDEIMGLTSGADDYITKPFSVSVLKIRLQNILNRKQPPTAADNILTSGDISLDVNTLRVFLSGREIDLSMTEFRLLQYFLENKNRVLLKEQILQRIWDCDGNFVEENTLSVNVSRLRKKLGSNCIRTIQGMGYLWEDEV